MVYFSHIPQDARSTDKMKYKDLRDFLAQLEAKGQLKRITQEVDPNLEMTEIADRTLRAKGPALLFENPKGYDTPVLLNLFGTPERVAMGMGQNSVEALREVGKLLAYLKEPEPPKGLKDLWEKLPVFKQVLNMPAKELKKAPCQEVVLTGDDVDLSKLPIQRCWPGDAAPLITWGLTVTKGPHKKRQNLGIYRQQVIAKNKVIMRWLSHRGGALDFREWCQTHPGEPYPVSVALGADPATILGAVTPVPDTLSEYAFAGLLRGSKTEVVKSISNELNPTTRMLWLAMPATSRSTMAIRSSSSNIGDFAILVVTPMISSSTSFAPRSMMSICPSVMGSKVPG